MLKNAARFEGKWIVSMILCVVNERIGACFGVVDSAHDKVPPRRQLHRWRRVPLLERQIGPALAEPSGARNI